MTSQAQQVGQLIAGRLVAGLLGLQQGSFSWVIRSSRRVAGQEGSPLTVLIEAPRQTGNSSYSQAKVVIAGQIQSQPGESSYSQANVVVARRQQLQVVVARRIQSIVLLGDSSCKQSRPNTSDRLSPGSRVYQRLPGSRKQLERSLLYQLVRQTILVYRRLAWFSQTNRKSNSL